MKVALVSSLPGDAKFYFWHVAVALGLFLLLIVIIDALNLDEKLSLLFYDPVSTSFPLRDDWLLETVEHVAARNAIIALELVIGCLWFVAPRFPVLNSVRLPLLFIFAAMALSALSVNTIRSRSSTYCPYDLQQYGGSKPYANLSKLSAYESPQGKCWPSAHAASGFCLFAWYFAARKLGRKRLAGCLLAAAALFGILLSAGRIAQGAHFLSHCVWSALICWFVTVFLYRAMLVRSPLRRTRSLPLHEQAIAQKAP